MSLHDLVDQLIRLLESEAQSLDKLRAAMQGSRTHWLALRPSELQSSIDQHQKMAESCALTEERRSAVAREIGDLLGVPGTTTVSRLSSRLPGPLAARLRTAAGKAARAAHGLRRESGMAARLLDFSQRSQESMFRSLGQLSDGQARSYDRNAKAVVQARAIGCLVDGRL